MFKFIREKIANYKSKKQKELEFCECFVETFNYLNKYKHLVSISVNENNFTILEKYDYIKTYNGLFGGSVNYIKITDKSSDVQIYVEKSLNDKEIMFSNKFSCDEKMNIFTMDELIIKSIIE